MNYKYNCGNEIIYVWVWDDDFHTEVTVRDNETKKSYDRTIREDKDGKFFTWNKNKIYLDKWIRTSMKNIKSKIERNECCTTDELCQAILSDGIDNVKFVVPFNIVSMRVFGMSFSDTDDFKDTICKIKEEYLYEINRNYKIKLIPIEPSEDIISCREFYTSDMLSLIESGHIKIVA